MVHNLIVCIDQYKQLMKNNYCSFYAEDTAGEPDLDAARIIMNSQIVN